MVVESGDILVELIGLHCVSTLRVGRRSRCGVHRRRSRSRRSIREFGGSVDSVIVDSTVVTGLCTVHGVCCVSSSYSGQIMHSLYTPSPPLRQRNPTLWIFSTHFEGVRCGLYHVENYN